MIADVLANVFQIAAGLIGAQTPGPTPSAPPIDPAKVSPGILGLISFVVLGLACVLIFFSLRKQLGRVKFDENAEPAGVRRVDTIPVRQPVAPGSDATASNGGTDDPGAGSSPR